MAFDTPSSLPPLPAAVEVAAYRIAQEALTNVARHAEAHHCLLHLSIDTEALHLAISDDRKGLPVSHRIGVGLHVMHERTSELGGNCTIAQGPSGGTTIQVRLPLVVAKDALAASARETEQPERENILAPDVSVVRQEEQGGAMDPIRILIAGDHPFFGDGLRALLESVSDMQVIGEAMTGNEVMAQAASLQPDVILMDIKVPGLNGIEATHRILILTMFEDDESVFAAVRA